jgi:hypothetical protein
MHHINIHQVFRLPQLRFIELPGLVDRILLPSDPVRIPYFFELNRARVYDTKIFDLEVDMVGCFIPDEISRRHRIA